MDCKINGVCFFDVVFDTAFEGAAAILSVLKSSNLDTCHTLHDAVLTGEYLNVVIEDGRWRYEFLAETRYNKGFSAYLMQSSCSITITANGNKIN
mgnify:FL=1